MTAALAALRLAPASWRPWRCRCGTRHPHIWTLCPYTNLPRDWT